MTDRAAITAELEEVKPVKTRKCLQIICEVPMESADAALEALGGFPIPGQSRPVAIALLKPAEQTERPKGGERAKRAGILCNDPAFQQYMKEIGLPPRSWPPDPPSRTMTPEATRTRNYLLRNCFVKSMRDLDHDPQAGGAFCTIVNEFGRLQRGDTDAARLAQRDRT